MNSPDIQHCPGVSNSSSNPKISEKICQLRAYLNLSRVKFGSPLGLLVLLLIPAFYLVVSSVIDIFKAYKEPEPATEGAGGQPNNNNGPVTLSEADKKRLKEQLLEEMISKKKGESHESK